MAGNNEKKKRAVFFIVGDGTFSTNPIAPGDRKVPTTWNPGKVSTKKKKLVVDNYKGIYGSKAKAIPRRRKPRSYKHRAI